MFLVYLSCKGTYFWGKYQKNKVKKDPPPCLFHKGRGVDSDIQLSEAKVISLVMNSSFFVNKEIYLLPSLYGRGKGVGLFFRKYAAQTQRSIFSM